MSQQPSVIQQGPYLGTKGTIAGMAANGFIYDTGIVPGQSGGGGLPTLVNITNSGSSFTATAPANDEIIYNVILTAPVVTVTLASLAAAGVVSIINFLFSQDATAGRSVNFTGGTVIGLNGTTPLLAMMPGNTTELTLISPDRGVTWFSTTGAQIGNFTETQANALYARYVNNVPPDISGNIAIAATTGYGAPIGGLYMPGWVAATEDPRRYAGASLSLVAGQLYCAQAVYIPSSTSTRVLYQGGGVGALTGLFKIGAYTTAGVKLGDTGDISGSSPFANQPQSFNWTSPFQLPSIAGAIIIAVLAASFTTAPTFQRSGIANTMITTGPSGSQGYLYFNYGNSLTDLPASLTLNAGNCTVSTPATASAIIACA